MSLLPVQYVKPFTLAHSCLSQVSSMLLCCTSRATDLCRSASAGSYSALSARLPKLSKHCAPCLRRRTRSAWLHGRRSSWARAARSRVQAAGVLDAGVAVRSISIQHFALGATFFNAVACPSLSGVQPLLMLVASGSTFLRGKHALVLAAPMTCWRCSRCSVQSLVVGLQSVLLCTA